MMKKMSEKAAPPETGASTKDTKAIATAILQALDRVEHRKGKPVEYLDPISGGIVRITRSGSKLTFRAPRVPEATVTVNPKGGGQLRASRNIIKVGKFLEMHKLLLAVLDENKLRGA